MPAYDSVSAVVSHHHAWESQNRPAPNLTHQRFRARCDLSLQTATSDVMRLTETIESMSFLAEIGSTRLRSLSPLFGSWSSVVVAVVAAVVSASAIAIAAGAIAAAR
jgi:hypothetical protein